MSRDKPAIADFDAIMDAGSRLDLSGCVYGEWRGGFVDEPHPYYYFLAGLVSTLRCTQILEIGTHYGGATAAMSRGIDHARAHDARIVTVDVTSLNQEALGRIPCIHRVHGDSLAPHVIDDVCALLPQPIDLLYVDSRHEHRETLQNIAVYANRLRPRLIVLDDIRLNDSMRELWARIEAIGAGRTTDVSELVRRRSAGFGVIECEHPITWPELRGVRQRGWLAFRRARRIVGPLVPARGKQLLRSPASWRSKT